MDHQKGLPKTLLSEVHMIFNETLLSKRLFRRMERREKNSSHEFLTTLLNGQMVFKLYLIMFCNFEKVEKGNGKCVLKSFSEICLFEPRL